LNDHFRRPEDIPRPGSKKVSYSRFRRG